jgi:pimeloyl-ACP methyl ester carboxylesterase
MPGIEVLPMCSTRSTTPADIAITNVIRTPARRGQSGSYSSTVKPGRVTAQLCQRSERRVGSADYFPGMTERTERNGVTLTYDTAGRGDPPIVFVHGWSCDRSYFDPQFEHFAQRHAVATLDLRGHGESSVPEPTAGTYEIDAFADDVLAVAGAAGFDRPVVVGHSMGAVTALACAARSGAVRAAVMVDPAPIVNPGIKAIMSQAADATEADADGSWRASFVRGMFLPTDTVRREAIISGMTGLPPAVSAAALRGIVQFDGVAALGAVVVPLLVIGAASPTDAPGDLRRACPTITIGQTVGAGHFNQLEVPDQVNGMIERFLAIKLGVEARTG